MVLLAVLLARFLFLFLFVARRFILEIKLQIEYLSTTQAHKIDKTHAPDHISLG